MEITIGMIKINVISNIASFNVGKTIICKNTTNSANYPAETFSTPQMLHTQQSKEVSAEPVPLPFNVPKPIPFSAASLPATIFPATQQLPVLPHTWSLTPGIASAPTLPPISQGGPILPPLILPPTILPPIFP